MRPLFLLLALASCTAVSGRPGTAPPLLPAPRWAQRTPPPAEWFWEPVEPPVRVASKPVELPVTDGALEREQNAGRVWQALGPAGRERLLRDGIVVMPSLESLAPGGSGKPVASEPREHMGAFYTNLREQRVPYVITLDAMSYALHVAFERALAEVDDTLLAPGLDALLEALDARLTREQKGAGTEIGEALVLARAIVTVARVVAHPPGPGAPPVVLSAAASQELSRIDAHAGVATSPLLGAPIDYEAFVAPPRAGHPDSFRALAWLSAVPLLFVAETEGRGGVVNVATSRLHTRVAMIFARLVQRDVDPTIEALYTHLTRLLDFVWGTPDDVTPAQLAELAQKVGVAIEDPKRVASVVTVDRVRKKVATSAHLAVVFDGSGAPERAGTGFRLFGGHAPADSTALAMLVGKGIGAPTVETPPVLARDGFRTLPSALDLPAWIGAKEGRASLHAGELDAFAGYDAALARAVAMRPDDFAPSRHATVHGSLLDVTMTWLAPEPAPARLLASPAAQRAAIESALASWTFARHDGAPLTRPLPPRTAPPLKELDVKGAALPAFVEQAPEVIAGLVATAAQMRRGLAVVGGLPVTSPAMTSLLEVEDLLRAAMRIASRESNGEELPAEDLAVLAALPARLARLEEGSPKAPAASASVIAQLAVDPAGARVLSTATGGIEPAILIVRDTNGDLQLVVGAHLPHYEIIETRATRSDDASHRARLLRDAADGREPPRGTYTTSFRLSR